MLYQVHLALAGFELASITALFRARGLTILTHGLFNLMKFLVTLHVKTTTAATILTSRLGIETHTFCNVSTTLSIEQKRSPLDQLEKMSLKCIMIPECLCY
jgi:hypothetical protein